MDPSSEQLYMYEMECIFYATSNHQQVYMFDEQRLYLDQYII